MANFCVKCGKPLTEGQICECEGGVPEQANVQAAPKAAEAATGASVKGTIDKINSSGIMADVKDVLGNIVNIYKNPEAVTKKDNSIKTTIIAFVIQVIVLFGVFALIIGRFKNFILDMAGPYGEDAAEEMIDKLFPGSIQILLIVALSCAIFYLLKVAFTFLIFGLWKKEKVDFKLALGKYSYFMIPLTITILLGYVASYIHSNLVIAIIGYGFIHYGLFTYKYFRDNFKVTDNFLMVITPLIIIVTTLIGLWLTGQITKMFIEDEMRDMLTTISNPFSSLSL